MKSDKKLSIKLDEKCETIMKSISDLTLTYKQLRDKTKFNDTTLSNHLKHLIEKQIIININKQYQKNPEREYFTTPYTITKIKMELTIKKRDDKFEYLHYEISRTIRNDMQNQLTSISSYFGDESVGHRWQELDIRYDMIQDGKVVPLYDSIKKPDYFYEDSPHMKKFRVDFPAYPIKKGEERIFTYQRNWNTKTTNTKFVYDPLVPATDIEFILKSPPKLDYELSVHEVDKYTYVISPSDSPILKTTTKNGNTFTWSSNSLSPHHCLEFRRKLI